MKRTFFIFFLLIVSCSDKKKELVNYQIFIEQGKKINLLNTVNLNLKNEQKINKLINSKYHIYKGWPEEGQNSKNLITSTRISIADKKKKSISQNIHKSLIYKKKIVTIDKNSKIKILDLDLKTILTTSIYKRSIYKNYNIDFKIIAYKDKLFIADTLGNLHCLSLKTLKVLWKKKYDVPFKSNIKVNKNDLFIINSNSKIFSINIQNGNLNWSFETSSKKIKDDNSYQIAIHDEKLFFTNDSAEIYCIDLSKNNILWSLVFRNENYQNKPLVFKSSPITIDNKGNLFVSSNYGSTYMIDGQNGSVKWSKPIYFINRFAVLENYLLNSFDDRIIILEKSSGNLVLNKKISIPKKKEKLNFKDVVIGLDNIYLFDKLGYLISINKKNLNQFFINKVLKNYHGLSIYNQNIFIWSENKLVKF